MSVLERCSYLSFQVMQPSQLTQPQFFLVHVLKFATFATAIITHRCFFQLFCQTQQPLLTRSCNFCHVHDFSCFNHSRSRTPEIGLRIHFVWAQKCLFIALNGLIYKESLYNGLETHFYFNRKNLRG